VCSKSFFFKLHNENEIYSTDVLALTEEKENIGVSDIGDQEQRLFTLLYYTLQEAILREGKAAEDSE
jgi:hypothetical protein